MPNGLCLSTDDGWHLHGNTITKGYKGISHDDLKLDLEDRSGSGIVKVRKFWLENEFAEIVSTLLSGKRIALCFELSIQESKIIDGGKIDLGFSVHDERMSSLAILYSSYQNIQITPSDQSTITVKCLIDDFPFSAGNYLIKSRILYDKAESDWLKNPIGKFAVQKGNFYGTGKSGANSMNTPFLIKGEWEIN